MEHRRREAGGVVLSDQSVVLLDSALILADLYTLQTKLIRNLKYLEAQGVELAINRIKRQHDNKIAASISQALFEVTPLIEGIRI
jgi:hypothetical protein